MAKTAPTSAQEKAREAARQERLKTKIARQEVKATRQAAKTERQAVRGARQADKAERKATKPTSGTAAPKRPISEGKPAPKGMTIAPRGSGTKEPVAGAKKTPREKAAIVQERLKLKEGRATGRPAPKEGIRATQKKVMVDPPPATAQANPRPTSMANSMLGFGGLI